MKLTEIHCQLCDVYGEHAMSSSMVRRLVRLFNEGRENVHDDPWGSRLSVVNEGLVRAVEKIRENRRLAITHFPFIFLKFHSHFLKKLCLINLSFGNCVHAGAEDAYGRTQIETAGQCIGLSDMIQ